MLSIPPMIIVFVLVGYGYTFALIRRKPEAMRKMIILDQTA